MKKILLLILFCCLTISTQHDNKINNYSNTTNESLTSFLDEELNDSILYLALLHYEVKHPKIVLAQAKLESGNFTSYHCNVNNNFLGLYNSKKGRYFKFNHWSDCIIGYKKMIEYKLKDGENYYDFLIRIKYAEDPNYIKKVKAIENTLDVV